MPELQLSPMQVAIVYTLETRGIRGTWIDRNGAPRLMVKMLGSMAASTVYATVDDPDTLKGFQVVGWRSGTMEEIKIARPLIYELRKITGDENQLGIHRACWTIATRMDWDGGPAVDTPMPMTAA